MNCKSPFLTTSIGGLTRENVWLAVPALVILTSFSVSEKVSYLVSASLNSLEEFLITK